MKKQHVNEFLTVTRCHYCQISARFAKRKYKHSKTSMEISGVSSMTTKMTSQVWLIRSGDRYMTVRSISHDHVPRSHSRSLFFAIRKCKMPPYAIAGDTVVFEECRFPHVAYVCHNIYIKALLLVRRKKEKEFFCGPNDTPMYPFFSPTPSSLDGEGTDKLYGIHRETARR